jgi:hypothetical protein
VWVTGIFDVVRGAPHLPVDEVKAAAAQSLFPAWVLKLVILIFVMLLLLILTWLILACVVTGIQISYPLKPFDWIPVPLYRVFEKFPLVLSRLFKTFLFGNLGPNLREFLLCAETFNLRLRIEGGI